MGSIFITAQSPLETFDLYYRSKRLASFSPNEQQLLSQSAIMSDALNLDNFDWDAMMAQLNSDPPASTYAASTMQTTIDELLGTTAAAQDDNFGSMDQNSAYISPEFLSMATISAPEATETPSTPQQALRIVLPGYIKHKHQKYFMVWDGEEVRAISKKDLLAHDGTVIPSDWQSFEGITPNELVKERAWNTKKVKKFFRELLG